MQANASSAARAECRTLGQGSALRRQEATVHDERRVRTADGVDLLVCVDGNPDADVAVVLAHGFSMTSRSPGMTALAGELGRRGFAVWRFDFRGHGASGGFSTLGDAEIWDLHAVVARARARSARVVVVGASMGGFIALRHAALLGGEDAVVAVSAPAEWGVAHLPRARVLTLAATTGLGRRLLAARGTRVSGAPPRRIASPPELAPDLKVPVAIVHGSHDPYVPLDDGLHIYEQLGGPREILVLPGYGHAEAGYSARFADVLEPLVRELLAAAPASSA
jgi:pimeloyl-ACP methyl ester carboxylesterase